TRGRDCPVGRVAPPVPGDRRRPHRGGRARPCDVPRTCTPGGRTMRSRRREPPGPDGAGAPPWARRPGEDDRAFGCFECYRDLGPGRTPDAVRKEYTQKPSYRRQLQKWSTRFAWPARALAWDEHQARLRDAAREAVVAAEAATWAARRAELLDRDWAV